MVVVCQIIIDKPADGVHRAGGTVSGVIKYAMDQPTQFQDMILSFRGESWCSWSRNRCAITTMYLGIDKHLTLETSLLEPCDKGRLLPAGPYERRFLFTLPKNIPPTFDAPTGNVTYRILLEIQRQDNFNVITRYVEAEVLVDNSLEPTVPETPMTYGITQRLLKPFSIGKLKMSLCAEIASPYVLPGEKAELKLDITNESYVRIKSITAELISTATYTASCGTTKTETQKIKGCATETAKVPSRQTTSVNISVPTFEELRSVQYSKAISQEYSILVTVRLPMPYCNISTVVPIVI